MLAASKGVAIEGWPVAAGAGLRAGLGVSSPRQLGQVNPSRDPAQAMQNVHSKLQMYASPESGGSALPQHSQTGRSSRDMHHPGEGQ
jgi:hypothetical protein